MKHISAVLMVLVFGCPTERQPPIDGGGLDLAAQQCEDIHYDVQNCGECGHSCTADADRCDDGVCQCGFNLPCEVGDCYEGRCIAPDTSVAPGCEFHTDCPPSKVCIEGYCTPAGCEPEVCDGFDNDCDGVVDGTGTTPLAQYCIGDDLWPGLPTDIPLPCSAGIRTCLAGAWTSCFGDVPPVTEVGTLNCDGVDNDCDGCIDSQFDGVMCVADPPMGIDIVYIIDISGSMGGEILAVKEATRRHASTLADPYYRFGLVLIGTSESTHISLISDLSEYDSFISILNSFSRASSGIEPSWRAVTELGNGVIPMSWRRNSNRVIVLFTDEDGQLPPYSEIGMCEALSHGESLYTVTKTAYFEDFDNCGTVLEITDDAVEMASNLALSFSDPCR